MRRSAQFEHFGDNKRLTKFKQPDKRTMSEHPKFPRNTIQEAVCEFRLRPSDPLSWTPKTPGQIFKALGADKFPGMEPINEVGFEIVVGPDGQAQQRFVQARPRFKFSNPDDTRLVQASPSIYAFNAVRNYPGWVEFQELILENWELVRKEVQPAAIERIGLRYINRIPAPPESQISDWLRHSPYIPEAIDQAASGIKFRLESNLSASDTVIVTILREPLSAQMSDIFLDLDRARLNVGLPTSAELRNIISSLHEAIWEIFESAKTERFDAYLNGIG